MMADQSQEPIFLHEAHRAFLETPSADVLDWKIMRLNLYRLKTGGLFRHFIMRWPAVFIMGIFGLMAGGLLIPLMTIGTVTEVWRLVTHGLSSWRLDIFETGKFTCAYVVFWMGGLIGVRSLNDAVLMAWWTNRRLYTLLQRTSQEGQLIRGYIESCQRQPNTLLPEITYRFNNPMGESIESKFYPELYDYSALTYEPGTPVWVLYLNDKTSVLL